MKTFAPNRRSCAGLNDRKPCELLAEMRSLSDGHTSCMLFEVLFLCVTCPQTFACNSCSGISAIWTRQQMLRGKPKSLTLLELHEQHVRHDNFLLHPQQQINSIPRPQKAGVSITPSSATRYYFGPVSDRPGGGGHLTLRQRDPVISF